MKRKILCLALCFIFSALAIVCNRFYQNKSRSAFAFAQTPLKTVCLTFDDGPTDSTTPFILNTLRDAQVKATFFIIGRQAKIRPELTRRIVREGHTIGVHSYTHEYEKIYRSKTALLHDIEECRQTIFEITGIATSVYRFPGGSFSLRKELIECVTTAGYTYYDWTASCRDAELPYATPQELLTYTKNSSKGQNKIILLCHDFAKHRSMIQALPEIIDYYKEKGYRFGTLSP